jgi:molecular chaperone GrpE
MSQDSKLPPVEIVEAEVVEEEGPPDPASLGLDLPEDPEAAIALLLRELSDARSEADSYLDDLRRVAADFENYRKRAQRDQAALVDRAAERVVRGLLPVLDSLDAAVSIEAQSEIEEKLLAGMRSTQTLLLDVLTKEGLEVISTWLQPFDPGSHEAATSVTPGEGRLMVAQELRRGYRLHGRVVRPALVTVEYEQGQ